VVGANSCGQRRLEEAFGLTTGKVQQGSRRRGERTSVRLPTDGVVTSGDEACDSVLESRGWMAQLRVVAPRHRLWATVGEEAGRGELRTE
jgi:hypothetical protein